MRALSHLVWAPIILILGCTSRPTLALSQKQQELVGKKLHWQSFKLPPELESSDHDHCVFCEAQMVEEKQKGRRGAETDGYTTEDGTLWVCNRCFDQLNSRFRWVEK